MDVLRLQPIARMGCFDYTVVDNRCEMVVPGSNRALLAGMQGSAEKSRLLNP